jgi:hypothetical protein
MSQRSGWNGIAARACSQCRVRAEALRDILATAAAKSTSAFACDQALIVPANPP